MAGTTNAQEAARYSRFHAWFGEPAGAGDMRPRAALADVLFLTAMVVLSCVPYVAGLGLYSDDWFIISVLHGAQGSYPQLVAAIMPIEMATRPVQALVLAALYAWFGLEPLGYHIVNSLVLAAAVVLFHLSLRTLGFSRVIALLVPLVFALLPHYSTDRVWIAAFQANVSVCLYFLSLYADLRFVQAHAWRWLWKAIGAVALVAGVLAYEVTAALLLFNVLVLAHHARLLRPREWTRAALPTLLGIAGNVVLLGATVLYKLSTTVRADVGGGYRFRVLRIFREAMPVHFGDYGIELPIRVAQLIRGGAGVPVLAVGALIGVAVAVYLLRTIRDADTQRDRRVSWFAVVVLGVIVFGLGYGMTMMTWQIGFHTTGANNRTAIAAALGVSFVFVGIAGLASGLASSERARRFALAVLIGLLAASSAVITAEVANRWAGAARRQEEVIAAIRQRFPEMRPGTTLLIDGLCPYVGPAPVFATSWDMTGMLQLTYGERDLQGDVLKPNSEVTPAGIRTILFDDVINVYPYGEDLYVQHLGTGDVLTLASEAEARRYFETISTRSRVPCPPYTDGNGAAVF